MKRKVYEAYANLRDAKKQLADTLKREHPVGSRTVYFIGDNGIVCTILDHSDDRVFVRGNSGKKYWVCGSRLDGGR